MIDQDFALQFLSLFLLPLFLWFVVRYYWARVIAVSALLFLWAVGPPVGAYIGLRSACSGDATECLSVSAVFLVLIGLIGIAWLLAFRVSAAWIKQHPPKHFKLADRID